MRTLMYIGVVLSFAVLVACGPSVGGGPDQPIAGTIVKSDSNGNCSPSADQAAFFVEDNYAGQCVVLSTGDFDTAAKTGLPDNSISSVKVGANVQTVLCADANFGGKCETITKDDPTLGDNPSIAQDVTSSVRVRNK